MGAGERLLVDDRVHIEIVKESLGDTILDSGNTVVHSLVYQASSMLLLAAHYRGFDLIHELLLLFN